MVKTDLFELSRFNEHLRSKGTLSNNSIRVYMNALEIFLRRNPDVDSIEEYNKFIVEHSIKKRSNHFYSILRTYILFRSISQSQKDDMLKLLIKPGIRHDMKRQRRHINEDKILEVINSLQEYKHKIIAIIQTMTGVRAGDVIRLKKKDAMIEDYEGKPVLRLNIIGKGDRRNIVFIHDEFAQKLIMDYINSSTGWEDFCFIETPKRYIKTSRHTTDDETRYRIMSYWWYWKDMKMALNSAHIAYEDFSTHDVRRCFARRVWEKYKDLFVLQNMLNHADPKTSMRYLRGGGLLTIDYSKEMQIGKNEKI